MKLHELSGVACVSIAIFLVQNPPDADLPKVPTSAEQANMSAENLRLRQGPSMQMLIGLAETGNAKDREYYARVLGLALEDTGPVRWELLESDQRVFALQGHIKFAARKHFLTLPCRSSFAVLIPARILRAIRPAQRGYGFPLGVPFVELR